MVTNQWQPQTNFWGQLLMFVRSWWLPCTRWLTGNWLPISVQFAPPVHNHGKWMFFCGYFIKGASFHSPWINIVQNKFLSIFCHSARKSFFCTASTLSVTVEMAPQVFRGCVMLYWQGKVFCNPTATTVKSQNATNHIVLGNNIILWSTAFMRRICF